MLCRKGTYEFGRHSAQRISQQYRAAIMCAIQFGTVSAILLIMISNNKLPVLANLDTIRCVRSPHDAVQ
jgi:hypothetical protein